MLVKHLVVMLCRCMIQISPVSVRAARAILRWSMRDLERESGVAFSTINAIENEKRARSAYPTTLQALADAFARHGVELFAPPRAGARLIAPDA